MKAVITFLFALVLMTSCTIEYQCHSYGQTNQSTRHGKKAQAKYAKHNKHRSLF
ncbi:MAG TPA: hypothetical protein VKQ08_04310 [Cyclobacteriaceae bacterium]|nr:hypothetical protein [Cyclobacteriaceae bacterium]